MDRTWTRGRSIARRLDAGRGRRLTAVWAVLLGVLMCIPSTNALAMGRSINPTVLSTDYAATATLLSSTKGASAPSTVGALFEAGQTSAHSCTASVLDTPDGDLILTAAHCINGSGVGMTFTPGYSNGSTPYGTWTVTAAYGTQAWLTSGASTDDIAVLRVAPKTIDGVARSIQSVVGGEAIGTTAQSGSIVDVVGYEQGTGGSARTCIAATTTTTSSGVGYPTFSCGSYPGGTSGGPWLSEVNGKLTVVGLIGGLHQGGCSNRTSYSTPLDSVQMLVAHAETSGGDTFAKAPASGC